MPLIETKGAASAQGFGLTLQQAAANYIEDVFSTWLYTGNSTGADSNSQTISNGIDLSTKGGLVWIKSRNTAGTSNTVFDTSRGVNNYLLTNATVAASTGSNLLTSFNNNGFTVGPATSSGDLNEINRTYASWTFRKQPKFFDVVTYTGNGTAGRTVAHSLGSVPGFIMVKRTDTTSDWNAYHTSLGATKLLIPNGTDAAVTVSFPWNNTEPTATVFTVGSGTTVNANGGTYVAYLFAHNAGGFGLTGTDNVISCGSYTGNGSSTGPTVTLGYEPQWLMIKRATGGSGNWIMYDNMRGMPMPSVEWADLLANSSAAENAASTTDYSALTATGFQIRNALAGVNNSGDTYIYIAIRRGPMKTPTTGTSVFTPSTVGATADVTVGFPSDTFWSGQNSSDWRCFDRLRSGFELATNTTAAEGTFNYYPTYIDWDSNSVWNQNLQNAPVTNFWFRRAPGFFDVVCYAGTSGTRTVTHNLGVVPELMIFKTRTTSAAWAVYAASLGNAKELLLNTTNASFSTSDWNNTTPTSTVFTLAAGGGSTNDSGVNYVAYLFASCPGVSKVGSYTGTGALQTINCGFTGGARFVLIKRTDSTGDWFVFNSANGISSGNDPYRILNGTTLTSGTNYVDTISVGFQVTAAAPAGLNANGGTYIYLAIA